jgi:hypothetical protein
MLLGETVTTGVKQRVMAKPPIGPELDAKTAERTVKMELWGSEFKETDPRWPGEDFYEFRLFDANGHIFVTVRFPGY